VADLKKLVFLLLRYCGDVTKRESINVGVIAMTPDEAGAQAFAEVRFTPDWRRLQCFDPLVDMEELRAVEREIRENLRDPQKRAEMLKRAGDSYSDSIRVDLVRGCLTESPAEELEKLSKLYLETPRLKEKREPTGREVILNVMRRELEHLDGMQTNIPAELFTEPGDPLKLDFGYPAKNDFKFLQAISLMQRVQPGITLAACFPGLAANMQKKNGVKAWLTAVVDDELDRSRDEVTFALKMMRESGIVVARTAEVPQIADGIRAELRG
jgi:Protein of unknown function (DUF3037)